MLALAFLLILLFIVESGLQGEDNKCESGREKEKESERDNKPACTPPKPGAETEPARHSTDGHGPQLAPA
jgi:hypothetical protein